MQNKSVILILFIGLAANFTFFACQEEPAEAAPTPEMTEADKIQRGEYLVTVTGCNDCHTPKVMTPQGPGLDMERMLSGHRSDEELQPVDAASVQPYALFNPSLTAAIGPWGTSFSANLTPHESGLGSWTEEQFARALRQGKSKGMESGRMLLPPMPWQNFINMKDEDVSAIFAYLKSIPPVENIVPAPIPPTAPPAEG